MSPQYAVRLTRAATKEVAQLQEKIRRQVDGRLEELRTNPRPHDAKRLRGRGKACRIDMGEYRILYDVDDSSREIAVWRVRHHREAYRGL